MRKLFLTTVATSFLAFGSSASAGQINNLQLYDGNASPIVTINYTGSYGSGNYSATVYADPQVSYGTTAPIFYCVDLWHDNYIGSTYTITPVSHMSFSNSTFCDVDNRIGWLLSKTRAPPIKTRGRAACHLVHRRRQAWTRLARLFDQHERATDDPERLQQARLLRWLQPLSELRWPQFWAATHDPSNTLYQDLVTAPSSNFQANGAVPEPSSVVLGATGLVFLVGFTARQVFARPGRPAARTRERRRSRWRCKHVTTVVR